MIILWKLLVVFRLLKGAISDQVPQYDNWRLDVFVQIELSMLLYPHDSWLRHGCELLNATITTCCLIMKRWICSHAVFGSLATMSKVPLHRVSLAAFVVKPYCPSFVYPRWTRSFDPEATFEREDRERGRGTSLEGREKLYEILRRELCVNRTRRGHDGNTDDSRGERRRRWEKERLSE